MSNRVVGNSTQPVPAGSQGFSTQLGLHYGRERLPSRSKERRWDCVLSSVLASVLILPALQAWSSSQTVSPNPALRDPLTSCMRPAASTRGLILDSGLLLWVSHTLTPAPFYLSTVFYLAHSRHIDYYDWVRLSLITESHRMFHLEFLFECEPAAQPVLPSSLCFIRICWLYLIFSSADYCNVWQSGLNLIVFSFSGSLDDL